MKKFKFLLFSLLMAYFSFSSANAQTIQQKYDGHVCKGWVCQDGVEGYACGAAQFHLTEHYNKDGYLEWFNYHVKSKELISPVTGEKFRFNWKHYENAYFPGVVFDYYVHYTMFGNMGTKILFTEKWRVDTSTGEFTLIHEMYKCL